MHVSNQSINPSVIPLIFSSTWTRGRVTSGSRAGDDVAADVRGADVIVQQRADVITDRWSAGATLHLPGPARQSEDLHLGRCQWIGARNHADGTLAGLFFLVNIHLIIVITDNFYIEKKIIKKYKNDC